MNISTNTSSQCEQAHSTLIVCLKYMVSPQVCVHADRSPLPDVPPWNRDGPPPHWQVLLPGLGFQVMKEGPNKFVHILLDSSACIHFLLKTTRTLCRRYLGTIQHSLLWYDGLPSLRYCTTILHLHLDLQFPLLLILHLPPQLHMEL